MKKNSILIACVIMCIMFGIQAFMQHQQIKGIKGELYRGRNTTNKHIQRLDSGIEFQTKRSKFLLIARDSIIRKHNPLITNEEAYSIAEFALYVCEKYKLNPILLFAVGRQESRFDTKAVSRVGAIGLYQIFPLTGRILCDALGMEYSENLLYDMKINTELACKYLSYLKAEYAELDLILIGYNAGPGWIQKYKVNKRKLPTETEKYIKSVRRFYKEFSLKLAFYLPGNLGEGNEG